MAAEARAGGERDPAYTADIRRIHGLRREAGLDDAAYRALLERVTGKRSASALAPEERRRVVAELARTAPPRARREADARHRANDYARKAEALWITLHQLGAVDDPSVAALEAFARRQTGVARLEWLQSHTDSARAPAFRVADASKVIDALKVVARRHGWNPDGTAAERRAIDARRAQRGLAPATPGLVAKLLALRALWRELHGEGAVRTDDEFALDGWVAQRWWAGVHEALNERDAHAAAAELGRWLRRHRGAGTGAPGRGAGR